MIRREGRSIAHSSHGRPLIRIHINKHGFLTAPPTVRMISRHQSMEAYPHSKTHLMTWLPGGSTPQGIHHTLQLLVLQGKPPVQHSTHPPPAPRCAAHPHPSAAAASERALPQTHSLGVDSPLKSRYAILQFSCKPLLCSSDGAARRHSG